MRVRPNMIVRRVGEELVLLDIEGGRYYGLDPIGARIWAMIADGVSLTLVVDRLLEEFEVTREELERDVTRLVGELEERGLVTS